jgi:hypothetical protein
VVIATLTIGIAVAVSHFKQIENTEYKEAVI